MHQEPHTETSDFLFVFLSSCYPPFPSSLPSPIFSFSKYPYLLTLFFFVFSLLSHSPPPSCLSFFEFSSSTSDLYYAQLYVQKRRRSTAEYVRQKAVDQTMHCICTDCPVVYLMAPSVFQAM